MIRLLFPLLVLAAVVAIASVALAGPPGQLRLRGSVSGGGGADFNISFGTKTRSGHGGYLVSVPEGSVITGTGASDWAIDSRQMIVPSGTYGNFKTFAESAYSLTVAGVTIDITMLSNAAHVREMAGFGDTISSFQLRTLMELSSGSSGALVLGDTVWARDGQLNPAGELYRIRPPAGLWAAGSGPRIIVRSETVSNALDSNGNPARLHGFKIGGLLFDSSNSGDVAYPVDFRDVQFYRDDPSSTEALFDHNNTSGYGIGFYNIRVAAGPSVVAPQSVPGLQTNKNSTVDDSTFTNLGKAVVTELGGLTVTDSIFYTNWNDTIAMSGGGNSILRNLFFDFRWVSSFHPDTAQQNCTSTGTDFNIGTIQYNLSVRGTATPGYIDAQGFFARSQTCTDRYLNTVAKNNIFGLTMRNQMFFSTSDDPNYSYNTALTDFQVGPVITNDPPGTIHSAALEADTAVGRGGTGGVFDRNLVNDVELSNQTSIASQAFNLELAKDITTYTNALGNYTNSPAVLVNRAAILTAYTPTLNGTAKNADGTYSGALFPACTGETIGGWNDGTVFADNPTFCDAHPPAQ